MMVVEHQHEYKPQADTGSHLRICQHSWRVLKNDKKQSTDREVQKFLAHRSATTYRISNFNKLESECFLYFMNSANSVWFSGESVQRSIPGVGAKFLAFLCFLMKLLLFACKYSEQLSGFFMLSYEIVTVCLLFVYSGHMLNSLPFRSRITCFLQQFYQSMRVAYRCLLIIKSHPNDK
uniref:Uncharacterized protein n=1 Tax=Glossina pallidipes TaxID=7398 RepID=A0A1B0A9U0_GLOPL